jgi:ribosomal-protein-alanine N-acetyltransferase
MNIRLASRGDIDQLARISEKAGAARWSAQQWDDLFDSETPARLAWLAENGAAQSLGMLVAQCSAPDWELENMAVLPAAQRKGVGSALMEALLTAARAAGASRVLLEVRPSNHAAIALYNISRFELLARRPDYYRNPEEDALILVRTIVP